MYKNIISPMLDRLDSETMHVAAREALHVAESNPLTLKLLERFAYEGRRITDERLNVCLGEVKLDNPILVGAGWDKVGHAVKALYQLGFAGVEVGSVLRYLQKGNPKPRQWMIAPGVSFNRLGFNTPGMYRVMANIERYINTGIPIGISLGQNKEVSAKDAPLAHGVVAEVLYPYASYFVINVSSPNTPGLRQLQNKGPLTEIVQYVNMVMDRRGKRKPLFVKIAPDLTNEAIDDVIELVLANGLTGIVATNTTINSDIKARYGENYRNESGGLAGNDEEFRRTSTDRVRHIYKQTQGTISIIGVGGVHDVHSALEKITAGANALQIVTGIRGEGTSLPGRINLGLLQYIQSEGVSNINELVGVAV